MAKKQQQVVKSTTQQGPIYLSMQSIINDVCKVLAAYKKDPKNAQIFAHNIINDNMSVIAQHITLKPGKPQAYSYVLHALLVLLSNEKPAKILDEQKYDVQSTINILTAALKLPRPDVSAYERIEQLDKQRSQKNKKECDAMLASLGINIAARERSRAAYKECAITWKKLIQFVDKNWDFSQQQLKKWEDCTKQYSDTIVTSKHINWEKLLETVPVDKSKIGETVTQEEMVSAFGMPSIDTLYQLKHTIVKRLDSPDKVKAFRAWFVGKPSKLHAEYFDLYKYLIEQVSGSTAKRKTRRTKTAEISVEPKIQQVKDENSLNEQKEKTPATDMSDLMALKILIDWLVTKSETALQQEYDAELEYQIKKEEADASKDPIKRAELLNQQIALNQAVLDSTKAFDYWTAAVDEGKKLMQEQEKNAEFLRQAQIKMDETKEKIALFITKCKQK